MTSYGLLEQVIRGLDDDELEELTRRLAHLDHPEAHRTGRGGDDGVDVVSDWAVPPARGWQAKCSSRGTADWTKCEDSLTTAMGTSAAPPHYTFVFSHRLSERQRQHWRDKFHPVQLARYEHLETLDYWDDVARRAEPNTDIVDWLVDGALGVYVRRVLAGSTMSGPAEPAGPEVARAAASYSERLGAEDPRFAFGIAGRQAVGGNDEPPDGRVQFSMSAGQRSALPHFTLTVRDGDGIEEITATARAGKDLHPPEPWFADTPDGELARATARASLAKGRSIELTGEHVGIAGGDVPVRFKAWTESSGTSSGTLGLGVSEPLDLTITLAIPGLGELAEQISIYRVPPQPGAELAYAGAIGGAVLAFDLVPGMPPTDADVEPGSDWVNCVLSVTLAVHEEPAHVALQGLGFARAFGEATMIKFECPGLLPTQGYDVPRQPPLDGDAAETWEVAATIATALDRLQRRDGVERLMPGTVGPRDFALAQIILHLLDDGEIVVEATDEFEAPLPPHATVADDATAWMTFTAELPPFVGQPTRLLVEQRVEGAIPLRIARNQRGALALVCRPTDTAARLVSKLVDEN